MRNFVISVTRGIIQVNKKKKKKLGRKWLEIKKERETEKEKEHEVIQSKENTEGGGEKDQFLMHNLVIYDGN